MQERDVVQSKAHRGEYRLAVAAFGAVVPILMLVDSIVVSHLAALGVLGVFVGVDSALRARSATLWAGVLVVCANGFLDLLIVATETINPAQPGSSTRGLAFVFIPFWHVLGCALLCGCHVIGLGAHALRTGR